MQRISNANDLVAKIIDVGNVIVYVIIFGAVIYIIWNAIQYFIRGKEGDENRKEAIKNVGWGIVGLAIILSIWGLVAILINTFNVDTNTPRERFPQANFVERGGNPSTPREPLFDAPQNWGQQYEGAI